VSDVESLTPGAREPESLRRRWPGARVDVLPARVAGPEDGR
jgi:hypothetical protein